MLSKFVAVLTIPLLAQLMETVLFGAVSTVSNLVSRSIPFLTLLSSKMIGTVLASCSNPLLFLASRQSMLLPVQIILLLSTTRVVRGPGVSLPTTRQDKELMTILKLLPLLTTPLSGERN